MKKCLCIPCALKLAEAFDVKKTGPKTEKITCDECGRRRFGCEHTVEKKTKEE